MFSPYYQFLYQLIFNFNALLSIQCLHNTVPMITDIRISVALTFLCHVNIFCIKYKMNSTFNLKFFSMHRKKVFYQWFYSVYLEDPFSAFLSHMYLGHSCPWHRFLYPLVFRWLRQKQGSLFASLGFCQ
jgi:hypothetical protein